MKFAFPRLGWWSGWLFVLTVAACGRSPLDGRSVDAAGPTGGAGQGGSAGQGSGASLGGGTAGGSGSVGNGNGNGPSGGAGGAPRDAGARDAPGARADAAPEPSVRLPPELARWRGAYVEALCAKATSCCELTQRMAAFGETLTPETCRKSFGAIADRELARRASLVEQGRLRFDPERGATCLRDMMAAPCSALGSASPPPSCAAAFVGLLPPGRACVRNEECADGHCAGTPGVTRLCRPGLPCWAPGGPACPAGTSCNRHTGSCEGPKPAGTRCHARVDQCQAGLVCVVPRTAADGPVCSAPGPEGTRCFDDAECQAGLVCGVARGGRACTKPLPAGARCDGPGCAAGLRCLSQPRGGDVAPSICARPGALDEPCVSTAGACAEGLVCATTRGVTGTCRPAGGLGESCFPPSRGCQSPLYCDSATGTCKTPSPPGGPCRGANECTPDAYCPWPRGGSSVRICQPRSPIGGPCIEHAQCVATAYCDGVTELCRPKKELGATCVDGAECSELCLKPNHYHDGVCAPRTAMPPLVLLEPAGRPLPWPTHCDDFLHGNDEDDDD